MVAIGEAIRRVVDWQCFHGATQALYGFALLGRHPLLSDCRRSQGAHKVLDKRQFFRGRESSERLDKNVEVLLGHGVLCPLSVVSAMGSILLQCTIEPLAHHAYCRIT